MSINSRAKGSRFELQVRDAYRDAGFTDVERTPMSGGHAEKGDLYHCRELEDFCIECKTGKKIMYEKSWQQASVQAKDKTPILHHKVDRGIPLVTLRETDFLQMLRSYLGKDRVYVNKEEE